MSARGVQSARAFLEQHARAGRVGLVCGTTSIERLVRRAQRPLTHDRASSAWSHAFLFEGARADGRQWLIESDLDLHKKQVRLGVQENRVDKYHDERAYPELLVLDFGLTTAQETRAVAAGLELVASRVRYSLRELFGTLLGMRAPALRKLANPLAREHSLFCSAFVVHVLRTAGVDPLPDLDVKHCAPEDLARSPRVKHAWGWRAAPTGSSRAR